MLQNYRLVWDLLNRRERQQFVLLVILTILMSIFEVLGVAAILPFLALLGDPGMIESNRLIATFARITGLTEHDDVSVAFGFFVLAMLLLGMVVRTIGTYGQIRFGMMRAYSISTRVLRLYLRQPYVWFLSQNTSEFGQTLLSEVDIVARRCIMQGVQLISHIAMTLFITLMLFLAAPGVALGAGLLLGGVYVAVYAIFRKRLDRIGRARIGFNKDRFKSVQEIGGGIKEIKVMGLETPALDRFKHPALGMAEAQSVAGLMMRLPRFALEAMIYGGFISMILLTLFIIRGGGLL